MEQSAQEATAVIVTRQPALFTRGSVKGVACGGKASRFKVLRREPATRRSQRRGESTDAGYSIGSLSARSIGPPPARLAQHIQDRLRDSSA